MYIQAGRKGPGPWAQAPGRAWGEREALPGGQAHRPGPLGLGPCFWQGLGRYWEEIGRVLGRYWGSIGKVLEGIGRVSGVLGRYWNVI